jgi:hypothetical protein
MHANIIQHITNNTHPHAHVQVLEPCVVGDDNDEDEVVIIFGGEEVYEAFFLRGGGGDHNCLALLLWHLLNLGILEFGCIHAFMGRPVRIIAAVAMVKYELLPLQRW